MNVKYNIDVVNQDFFKTIIKDENEACKCTALGCRYVEFKICPRIGDCILFPTLDLLDDALKVWIHQNVLLEVINVIHNPTSVVGFGGVIDCEMPKDEPDVILKVIVKHAR